MLSEVFQLHVRKCLDKRPMICFVFLLVFTKFYRENIPVLVLVVFRHSSVNADALKLLQKILDRISTAIKPLIQSTETTNKQLVRLAATQSSNMYS